jgi:hypothetical protein
MARHNATGAGLVKAALQADGDAVIFTATIANGESLSGAVDFGSARLTRIVMPAAWTAANLTFQSSYNGTDFNNLYDVFGTQYTAIADASRAIIIPPNDFIGIRYLKVRSGTSGSPVNQGGARSLILVGIAI